MTAFLQPNLNDNLTTPTNHLDQPGPIAFDATNLDYTVAQKRNEIYDFIRTSLGHEIIDVELDQHHMDQAITHALQIYQVKTSSGLEESFIFLEIKGDINEYILPKEVQDVRQVYRRGVGSGLTTSGTFMEPFSTGFMNYYVLNSYNQLSPLLDIYLARSFQKEIGRMMGFYVIHRFNSATKKLTLDRRFISGDPIANNVETVMIHAYNEKPESMLLNDFRTYLFVKMYALAYSKVIIGQARSKFGSIAGPSGGVSLNGDAMKAEGVAEMEKLETDLKNHVYSSHPPYSFIIG